MSSLRPTRLIDYGAFPDPPNLIFREYVSGVGRAGSFFADDWSLEGVVRAAERVAAAERPRAEVATRLAEAQLSLGADAAAASARALAQPASVVVVTGQQAGLFGGPLLVLYKALGTLAVARALEARRTAPVVPLFWVASDDHDFAEVRGTALLDSAGTLVNLRYGPTTEPAGLPAALIVLDDKILVTIDELAASLAGAPFRDFVLDRVRAAYRPGVTLADAFAHFLSSLLPDLIVLDGSAGWLKTLAQPILARELREHSETSRRAAATGVDLLAAGYHQQVALRPSFLNLFLFADGERRPLASSGEGIEIRGTGRRLTLEAALESLRAAPSDWSPGVLLRPLVQDSVLPTAAYVAGPAEVAYHAQLGGCYAHLGLLRPAVVPRPGVTLVEPREARAIEAAGIELVALQGGVDEILSDAARAEYPEVENAFEAARQSLRREMAAVERALAAVDPTLRAAVDATVGRALHPIESLHEKALRALKRRDAERAERLRRTRELLFPGGALQERALGLVAPLARHGESLITILRETIDPWARGHQVIQI